MSEHRPWKIEYVVVDQFHEDMEWFDTADEAIVFAQKYTNCTVTKISHYDSKREKIWPVRPEEDDD